MSLEITAHLPVVDGKYIGPDGKPVESGLIAVGKRINNDPFDREPENAQETPLNHSKIFEIIDLLNWRRNKRAENYRHQLSRRVKITAASALTLIFATATVYGGSKYLPKYESPEAPIFDPNGNVVNRVKYFEMINRKASEPKGRPIAVPPINQ